MAFSETSGEVSKTPRTSKLDFDPDKLIGSDANETKGEVKAACNETIEPIDADKLIEPAHPEDTHAETVHGEYAGGSYHDVKIEGDGEAHEVHHMPAADVNGLKYQDGPAIRMDKLDHRKTASCGNSLEARAYREIQSNLISEGKFKEAMQMDIDDIHDKFGDKYDDAIAQMITYATEKGLIS